MVKVAKIGYEQAESFLYFLDKNVTVMVGGSGGLNKFYKNNHSKTLLDRLTASELPKLDLEQIYFTRNVY